MTLTRLPDWDIRAARWFRTVARRPFAWGSNDCALFCAGAVLAMTGVDLAAEWRGAYGSEAEARDILKHLGCDSVLGLPERVGLPMRHVHDVRRGDIVAIQGERGPFLAVDWQPAALGPASGGLEHIAADSPRLFGWGVG